MISIIIRTKNEERWIGECLVRVLNQRIEDKVEIILVDNQSEDYTVIKAKQVFPRLKALNIENYLPGKAINIGVNAAQGDFIAILSAHCLPQDNKWLHNLKRNFLEVDNLAGVYGRQVPMTYSDPSDKRDLLVTFGLDRIVQTKGTFFHNANSMINRNVWEEIPFDDSITNIEDRIWGKQIIKAGYSLVYEPDAVVYHHHGIHQNNNPRRLKNVVKIIDDYDIQSKQEKNSPIDISDLKIAAVIPFRSEDINSNKLKAELFNFAYEDVKKSNYINKIILFTNDDFLNKYSIRYPDVEAPIFRPQELDNKRLVDVFKYLLNELALQESYLPDLVVPIELIYPFRPERIFDLMIEKLVAEGLDTVVPGYKEFRACWKKNNARFVRLDQHQLSRDERKPIHVGVLGLGFITYPELLRRGIKYGDNLGLIDYSNPLIKMEMRTHGELAYLKKMLNLE